MDDNLGFFIVPAFLVVFPLFWMGIVKLISLFGWQKFVNDRMMRTEPPLDAKKFAMQSIKIGATGNYSNCVNAWIHHSGLFLKPMWMFSTGHPLILLNWQDITAIEEKRVMMINSHVLTFWKDLPKITLYGRLGQAAKQAWEGNSHQSHHVNRGI